VLGDVVAVTVRLDAIGDDSLPVAAALQPLSRLGRDEWGEPPTVFRLARPSVRTGSPGDGREPVRTVTPSISHAPRR